MNYCPLRADTHTKKKKKRKIAVFTRLNLFSGAYFLFFILFYYLRSVVSIVHLFCIVSVLGFVETIGASSSDVIWLRRASEELLPPHP